MLIFHSLKYLRSATFGSKDKVIRKSEFVAKTQFLSEIFKRNYLEKVLNNIKEKLSGKGIEQY